MKTGKLFKKAFYILFILLSISLSCTLNNNYEEYKEIPKRAWNKNDTLQFRVAIDDTTKSYDIFINLRHDGTYLYSNMFFFLDFSAPNGTIIQDTLEYYLVNNQGEWLGKGWGNIWSHQLPFKSNVRFPFSGIYTFKLIHGMRDNQLPGVISAGLSVKPHKRD